MSVRVRFAPSPTGQLHVGNARTALFNWLVARGSGGTFVLRIEDTDAERSTRESERTMIDDLAWLGLTWDEGPDVGGPHGPYRQSDRQAHYAAAAERLAAAGRAYPCFCTPAMLDADRQDALAAGLPPKYIGRCRSLGADEIARRRAAGERPALRFVVPPGREVVVHDLVRGDVSFSTDVIGDPIIVRSDGSPAYNFAVVVDDGTMEISHVVRGEDHLSNTPRQVLIYEALGRTPPVFAHLALVLGPDHAPLSKRHGATSVAEFRARGYLPEALVNYLGLLGWSPGGDEEIVSLDEMARRFDVTRVGHSAAVFDLDKLAWINREYMKAAEPARLARRALPFFERDGRVGAASEAALDYVVSILPLAVGSVDRLDELSARVAFLFDWDAAAAAALVGAEPDGARAVAAWAEVLDGREPLVDRERFRAAAAVARERSGLKGRALFHPLRVAFTSESSGPDLDLAVPAIERGAALTPDAGIARVPSCFERLRAVAGMTGKA
jgi:glutamyl-tRNA synthetase